MATLAAGVDIDTFIRPSDFTLPGGEWFIGAGLGLFVHWDHASQQGIEISWPLVGRSIIPGVDEVEDSVTTEQYYSSAATFNPIEWDAKALAALAKRAGAEYVVFTARHHGGYSMFHTEYSDFGVQNGPFGRDITREFVDAIRAEGIRVGIYFSLPDWHHPDYPAFEDTDRPYPEEHWPGAGLEENIGKPIREDRHRRATPEQWERFQSYLRGQLTEILTNYGTIDLLWFDGEWERNEEEWDTAGLRALIKGLQPDVVINERLLGQGDYKTPEQAFPIVAPAGPWELCLTIGDMWAYRPGDINNKSVRSLVTTLIEVVGRGGNLLLNIGPKGDGSLNEVQVERLESIGEWMDRHRESVIGVSPTVGVDFYGPTTARPGTVYLHLVNRPVEEIIVRGLPVRRVSGIRLLATGQPLDHTVGFEVHELASHDDEPSGELRIPAPEPSGAAVDVVAIDFA
ncbi:alpha-L-fucosidase [Herbiconiux sp. UC225_62]|uniref:alpha-L-fucosidase n=1 Tax=Herbiconiux sp. UC225_62 TaxID=3350168 RepID=UPI0036D2E69D